MQLVDAPLTQGWLVLLIGGHSGAGKSTLAAQIARRTGAGHVEADDVRMAIQRVTSVEQLPALHYFASAPGVTRPRVWQRDPDELVRALSGVAEVVSRALGPVVGHHIAARKPVVIDGDGILPGLAQEGQPGWTAPLGVVLAERAEHALRSVFLVEPDQAVVRSRMGRGQDGDTQGTMHWRYGQWLQAEAERLGQLVVEPRPYETLLERVLKEVGPTWGAT
jgi:2-phosphoglycerate kinase